MQVMFIGYSSSQKSLNAVVGFFFCFFSVAGFLASGQVVLGQTNPFAPGGQPAANNAGTVNPAINPGGLPNAPSAVNQQDPNLIIRRYYELQPSTPLELAEAIMVCTQIRRTDVARKYIVEFEKLRVSPSQATLVQQRLGTAFLYEVSTHPGLQPEGPRFSLAIRQGALAYMRDTTRIKGLLDNLGDPDQAVRAKASDTFKDLDVLAVVELGAALGDVNHQDSYAEIQRALIGMGSVAVEPMIGYLDVSSPDHRARVITVLGGLGNTRVADRIVADAVLEQPDTPVGAAARQALLKFVGVLPTKQDAKDFLQIQLDRLLSGDLMLPVDEFNRVTLWKYDAKTSRVVPDTHDGLVVSLVLATQVSRDLYSLDTSNAQYKRQFLRSILASSKVLNGVNQPLADGTRSLVSQESQEYVMALLEHCLEVDNVPAAVGAAEVLGDIGDTSLVYSPTGRPTPLVNRLSHSSRRVRFAVAEAIMNINPDQPFPGCTFLSEAAGYFLQTTGRRKVLTGDVLPERSQAWAGLLAQMGFSGDRASSGRDLVRRAQQSSDYEFLLIGESITAPHINEVIYMLRHDPRTAGIPVGIVVHDVDIGRAKPIAAVDPLTFVLTEPTSVQGLLQQTRPLMLTAKYQETTTLERLEQANVCLQWLARVLADPSRYEFYDAYRQQRQIIEALFVPQLSPTAASALSSIGSDDAQRALITFASKDAEIMKNRQAALAALKASVQHHRILLTRTEILNQYNLYNKSLSSSQENIDVLSGILDILEAPTKSAPSDK